MGLKKKLTQTKKIQITSITQISRILRYCQCKQTRMMSHHMTGTPLPGMPVENSIKKKLTEALQPTVLQVMNESYMHNVPKGSETHFKVVVVTEKFDQLPLIKRHRMVNQVLDEELKTGVHALSITAKTQKQWETVAVKLDSLLSVEVAKTPKQWEDSGGKVGQSPPCRGGAGL